MKVLNLFGVMKRVFLSHRQADTSSAGEIFRILASRGVPAYLDAVDPTLAADSERLTEHLRTALNLCTYLLAIVSDETQGSWWVPFEIGLATERNYSIATYLLDDVRTPEYLDQWPYLRTHQDLQLYIDEVQRRPAFRMAGDRRKDAVSFHRNLKRALGQ